MLGIAILAAGKGKRMNSPEQPKVLALLNSKSLLGYVLDTALTLNPLKIYVIVGYKKNLVVDFVNKFYPYQFIEIVEQKEQLGTGHAILQLKNVIDLRIDDLLILSGDVPLITSQTLKKFIQFHIDGKFDLSLISTIVNNPSGYGRIIREINGKVLCIVEDKDLKPGEERINEINAGIYIFRIENLFNFLQFVKNDNAQQEYYLTDLVEIYRQNEKSIGAFLIENHREVLGINTQQELLHLEEIVSQK